MSPYNFYAFLWVHMCPSRSFCVPLDSNGFLWVVIDPYASLRVLTESYRSLCALCVLIRPYAFLWVLIDPYASLLFLMGTFRSS